MGSNILDEYAPKRGALQIPAQVNYLNEIKVLVRTMPYGDFIEMATAIGSDHTKMWAWANESPVLVKGHIPEYLESP